MAAAGGGGRGMRVVSGPAELDAAFAETTGNAEMLFGDGRVYLERYLTEARHVEVQILCDAYGNGIHLGERDCSVQRRHQKLIEESPAPALPAECTERMRQDAVRGALATGYIGAGTVEFLVDSANRHYFIEVNCRIQVEHPVTEMVAGIDLVEQQLRVAAGERLPLAQADLRTSGVAIQCRINAEDPTRDFAPTAGQLDDFLPPGGPFVRIDTHAYPGYQIPVFYDSLLAKLIVWGPDRPTAIARMRCALREFRISGRGVCTTIEYLDSVLAHPAFQEARHTWGLLESMRRDATAG
jgi:acetyl-CoA carboxylase biotin carboxylase subunit